MLLTRREAQALNIALARYAKYCAQGDEVGLLVRGLGSALAVQGMMFLLSGLESKIKGLLEGAERNES